MILEFYIRDWLAGHLESAGVDVFVTVPADKPGRFFLVDKLGSTTSDRITTTHIAIQSWAESTAEAASLNEYVKQLMLDYFVEDDNVSSVRLNSDYPYPDTKTKHPRYQAVFDIVAY
jgi:hypothetical protein